MVLLVTASSKGQEVARHCRQCGGERVQIAATLREASAALRREEFSLLVMDQAVLEWNEGAAEALLERAGCGVLLLNLALSRAERAAREVRDALRRQLAAKHCAERAAREELRRRLSGEVTGILLHTGLALEYPGLPPALEAKLRTVRELATRLGQALEESYDGSKTPRKLMLSG